MAENTYKTLDGAEYRLDELSEADRQIYKAVQAALKNDPKPTWTEFANLWTKLVVGEHTESAETTELVIYKICQDMESRRGIEQGLIEPDEGFDTLKELGIAHNGKIIFMFYALIFFDGVERVYQTAIKLGCLDTYVFLLNKENILPFDYFFRNRPELCSLDLHDDFDGLVDSGYLIRETRMAGVNDVDYCYIAADGILWVLKHIPTNESLYKNLAKAAADKIKIYQGMSERQLFDKAFFDDHTITNK